MLLRSTVYDNILSSKSDTSHSARPIACLRLSNIFDSYIQISEPRILIRFYIITPIPKDFTVTLRTFRSPVKDNGCADIK